MSKFLRYLLVVIACSTTAFCRTSRPLRNFRSRVIEDIQTTMTGVVGIYAVLERLDSGFLSPTVPEVEALKTMKQLFVDNGLSLDLLPSELRGSTATLIEEVVTKLRVVKKTQAQHLGVGLEIFVVVQHGITLWEVTSEKANVDKDMFALSKLVENIVRDYFIDQEALEGLYVEKTRRKCEDDLKDALVLAERVRKSAGFMMLRSRVNAALGAFGGVLGGAMMIPGFGLPCQFVGGMGLLASAAMTVKDVANMWYVEDLIKPLKDYEHFLLEAKETVRRLESGTKLRADEIHEITAFADRVKESASAWRRMA